jgi:hypothetical protein
MLDDLAETKAHQSRLHRDRPLAGLAELRGAIRAIEHAG